MSKAKVLQEIRLPKKPKEKLQHPSSYLTVLDNKTPPCYITYCWVYKKFAFTFEHLMNGVEKLLQNPAYETILTAQYKRVEEGKLIRSDFGLSETVLIISAEKPVSSGNEDCICLRGA